MKSMNDAIIGGKNIVASYTKNGELLRLMYDMPDYRQFVDFFHTGVKINDSDLIYLHEDINNTYKQYNKPSFIIISHVHQSPSIPSVFRAARIRGHG